MGRADELSVGGGDATPQWWKLPRPLSNSRQATQRAMTLVGEMESNDLVQITRLQNNWSDLHGRQETMML